ncbi:phosphorylase [Castellaniella sp.]|uniref:ATP adenylyltransferase family protein n=1 Tax=Castellaniella sp. TaxID=1955812 RepID=UPI002B002226|nr:phosphorylase [Castellaniella sp.]
MESTFMQTVRMRTDAAIASGDLQPIQAEQVVLQDQGLPFIVRWVAALAAKDAAGKPASQGAAATTLPGGPRDPDFNPFLSPDPALLVGPVGDHHVAILNKFPVCLHHLVLARREFAEQCSPLEAIDFQALATVLSAQGGLGFYNGGAAAGASQRHKHVQWIPASDQNASLRALGAGMPSDFPVGNLARHPVLPLTHCFVRVDAGQGVDIQASAASMLTAFSQACVALDLRADAAGLLPPCNMLVGDGWMLVLPRSQEHFQGVSLNALSFGGTIYVRDPAQIDAIRAAGPLQALASVAY